MASVNLQKSYSNLNEKLAKQFDASGVRRSFTVPYIDGQATDEHVRAVGNAATQAGGITQNLMTTFHHAGGKGWGTGDGQTVGHPARALKNTIIMKGDEQAKDTIQAAQKHLSNISSLLGPDTPEVKTAQSQLNLVKKKDAAGMNLLDFGVMMTQIMLAPNKAVARAHSLVKHGGVYPKLTAPKPQAAPEGQEEGTEAQGEDQNQAGTQAASGAQAALGGPPAASEAASMAPEAASAPAAPVQAQG